MFQNSVEMDCVMNKSVRERRKSTSLRRSMTVLKKQMPELVERYKVKSLGIFGSFTRGAQTPRSDLDILVEFSETPDLFEFMDLEEHLSKTLRVQVDLVPRGALKGQIGERILHEVILV